MRGDMSANLFNKEFKTLSGGKFVSNGFLKIY